MVELVKQIIEFYLKNGKEPTLNDLSGLEERYIQDKAALFVTLYLNGEVRGSSGNVKEIESSIAGELIQNTIAAMSSDHRFTPLSLVEAKEIKVRVDVISERQILQDGGLEKVDPTKSGVVTIKKDYTKLATILPNMSAKLLTGADLMPVLEKKLGEKFEERNYIVYEIHTEVFTDY
ncbi:MAG: AMMECR1 domain-containing protein [Candidatus Peribacteria bacterium]|nr:MAG: AMMECR1 domain-containing protein [Candidatus Peribacteria bacterium]